jgi:uroporphyrinogen-III synthase
MAGRLRDKKVLITRAPGQSGRLRDALRAVRAVVLSAPAIQVCDPPDWAPLDRALGAIGEYDWLLFTSQSAVDRVCDRLTTVPPGLRIGAVGEATAARLRERGLPVHLVPAEARGEGLAKALLAHLAPGARLLLPRGDLADSRLPDGLRAAGCQVESVIAYRTLPASQPDPVLIQECSQGLDWVILTSGSTVTGLLALLSGKVPPEAKIAVLGPETAKAALAAGLHVHLVAPTATVESLVAAMDDH